MPFAVRNLMFGVASAPLHGMQLSAAARAFSAAAGTRAGHAGWGLRSIFTTAAAATLGGSLALRFGWGVPHPRATDPPKRDSSTVSVALADRPRAAVLTPTPQQLGQTSRQQPGSKGTSDHEAIVALDRARFEAFVHGERQKLAIARDRLLIAAASTLMSELRAALAPCLGRVDNFADWYFSYSTNYKLLGTAMSSAARHAVAGLSESSVAEAVSVELQQYCMRQYQAIVLRPALTDPELHRAFVRALRRAHVGYIEALQELDTAVVSFVAREGRQVD
eukprot:COSAG05_NODE_4577_length_1455_cov_1.269174_1_plen_278_part_00